MLNNLGNVGLCIPHLTDYELVFGINSPDKRFILNSGTLEMLNSSIFKGTNIQLSDYISGVAGKTRGVTMMLETPTCLTVCATTFDCNETRVPYSADLEVATYEIATRYTPCDGNGVPAELTVTKAQYNQYCMVPEKELMKNQMMKTDIKFLNQLDLLMLQLIKNYIQPANYKSVNLVSMNPLSNQLQLNTTWEMILEQVANADGMNIEDYVILGGLFTKFLNKEGVNLPIFYDRNVDALFGANAFVAIPKGAFQLVTWLDHTGDNSFMDSDKLFEKNTKTVPIGNTALTFDYFYEYDPKCSIFKYMPQLYAELVKALPGNCEDPTKDGIFVFQNCVAIPNSTC